VVLHAQRLYQARKAVLIGAISQGLYLYIVKITHLSLIQTYWSISAFSHIAVLHIYQIFYWPTGLLHVLLNSLYQLLYPGGVEG
jgi:hypothetical protein